MTTIIILLVVIYAAGVIFTAFIGWMNWSVARDMARSYEDEDPPLYLFTQSPMWPLLVLGALARILNDSKRDTTP